ncbi:DUF397 domain-containing protein [Streptomyces sp. NPDC127168]
MTQPARDLRTARWRKSSYTEGQRSGACIEVSDAFPGTIPVRDSKTDGDPVLTFTTQAGFRSPTTSRATRGHPDPRIRVVDMFRTFSRNEQPDFRCRRHSFTRHDCIPSRHRPRIDHKVSLE